MQRSSEGLHLPKHERLYQGLDMDVVDVFRNDCGLGGIHFVASLIVPNFFDGLSKKYLDWWIGPSSDKEALAPTSIKG